MISRLFNLADTIGWRFTRLLSTTRMRLTAGAAGVELGKGCRFYGRMKFKKAHTATIRIGSGCTFRSKPTSNLIGIDRPCIFSALMPEAELTIGPGCGFSGTVIGAFRSIRLGGGNPLRRQHAHHRLGLAPGRPALGRPAPHRNRGQCLAGSRIDRHERGHHRPQQRHRRRQCGDQRYSRGCHRRRESLSHNP